MRKTIPRSIINQVNELAYTTPIVAEQTGPDTFCVNGETVARVELERRSSRLYGRPNTPKAVVIDLRPAQIPDYWEAFTEHFPDGFTPAVKYQVREDGYRDRFTLNGAVIHRKRTIGITDAPGDDESHAYESEKAARRAFDTIRPYDEDATLRHFRQYGSAGA